MTLHIAQLPGSEATWVIASHLQKAAADSNGQQTECHPARADLGGQCGFQQVIRYSQALA